MKEQIEKYNLPKGWVWTKIEHISLRIHYGYTASATQNDTGIKLLRITDIQDNKVNWENVMFKSLPWGMKWLSPWALKWAEPVFWP